MLPGCYIYSQTEENKHFMMERKIQLIEEELEQVRIDAIYLLAHMNLIDCEES